MPIWYNYHHCMKVSTIIQNSSGMLMRPLKTVKIMWNYHPLQRLPISPQSSYTKAQSLMKMTSGKVLTTMATPPYPTPPLAAQLVRKLQHALAPSPSQHLCHDNLYSINYSVTITFALKADGGTSVSQYLPWALETGARRRSSPPCQENRLDGTRKHSGLE